jgi:hypothetical protein
MKNRRNKSTKKSDPEYPGYPKYPANEDIMNRGERVLLDDSVKPIEGAESLDVENGVPPENIAIDVAKPVSADPLDPEINNDEELGKRIYPVDFTGKDLDIPGSELDDETESTGNEDEENNLYSLGNPDQ